MVFNPFTVQIFTTCLDFNLPQRLESVIPLFSLSLSSLCGKPFFFFPQSTQSRRDFENLTFGDSQMSQSTTTPRLRHNPADDGGVDVADG